MLFAAGLGHSGPPLPHGLSWEPFCVSSKWPGHLSAFALTSLAYHRSLSCFLPEGPQDRNPSFQPEAGAPSNTKHSAWHSARAQQTPVTAHRSWRGGEGTESTAAQISEVCPHPDLPLGGVSSYSSISHQPPNTWNVSH